MCRRYVELYSVQKLEKKMKRINFINLFSLLGDEKKNSKLKKIKGNKFFMNLLGGNLRKWRKIKFYKFI